MQPLRTTISTLRQIKSEINPNDSYHQKQVEALERAIEIIEEIEFDVETR